MIKAFVKGTLTGIGVEIVIFVVAYLMNPQSFQPLSAMSAREIVMLGIPLFVLAAFCGGGVALYIWEVSKTP